jgi:hypothetical protein
MLVAEHHSAPVMQPGARQNTEDASQARTQVQQHTTDDASKCNKTTLTDASKCYKTTLTNASKCNNTTLTGASKCIDTTLTDASKCIDTTLTDASKCNNTTLTAASFLAGAASVRHGPHTLRTQIGESRSGLPACCAGQVQGLHRVCIPLLPWTVVVQPNGGSCIANLCLAKCTL